MISKLVNEANEIKPLVQSLSSTTERSRRQGWPKEGFKSRSALMRFSEAVDIFARDLYGSSWKPPIFTEAPMKLPAYREQATDVEQHYASALLKQQDPDLAFPEIVNFNDSIPSDLRRQAPELDITDLQWSRAVSLAEDNFVLQKKSYVELRESLDRFANLAFARHIRCFVRDQRTHAENEIDFHLWEVDEDALLVRYWSCSMNISIAGHCGKHLILVDRNSFPPLHQGVVPDYAKREADVREKLRAAKAISDRIPPHDTIGNLRRLVAEYLSCDVERAAAIINEETEGCWSKHGLKKKLEKQLVKQIEIVPVDRS